MSVGRKLQKIWRGFFPAYNGFMTTVQRPDRTTRPKKRRRPAGWIPDQHGAWAMITLPPLAGIVIGGPSWRHLPLLAAWWVAYFVFHSGSLWLKSRRRQRYRPPVLVYSAGAALAGLVTLAVDWHLIRWAPLFIVPLGVGLVASAIRDERSLWSGISTTVGSSLMTLVAFDAGGGTDFPRAWLLAGILAVYFAGTVLYVKTLIRERGSQTYYWLSVGMHALATLALIPLAPALTPVFAALTARAAIVPAFPVTPKQAGIGEIFSTIAVALTALVTV